MADKTTEKAQQIAREATAQAKRTADESAERVSGTVEQSGDVARRTTETASRSYEELLNRGQEKMEGMARASQAVRNRLSDRGAEVDMTERPPLAQTGIGDRLGLIGPRDLGRNEHLGRSGDHQPVR